MSNESSSKLGVAIVGCGTVGGATAQILTDDQSILAERVGPQLSLRYIVDVNFAHAESLGLDKSLFCTDLAQALDDESVGVVIELIGGTTIAKDTIERALKAGKHVVTANKALLAHHGAELYSLARQNGVCIAFEASCAGAIPIVRALCGGLIANRIDALYGIVNGTCNYILSEMTVKGQSYSDALAEAQRDGLAEADPTLDVAGIDSAHKLAILAGLAFGKQIDFDAIPVQGIDSLEIQDIEYGQELGYVVKLLAIAQRHQDGLSLRVRPAFISKEHPLAWVSGPFNAVSVYGHSTGHTMYYGRGAGGKPTASAVVADIAAVATGSALQDFQSLKIWPDISEPAVQLASDAIRSRYYLRVTAKDTPGVLARIAAILAEQNISISSMLQHEPQEDKPASGVSVVLTTDSATEGGVQAALKQIDALQDITAPSICIGIVDEHEEQL